MRFNEPRRLAAGAGELRVREGAVWLTRRNDAQDHLLQPGQRLRLSAGDAAVIEPWQRDHAALVDWQPAGAWSVVRQTSRAAAGHFLSALAGATTALAGALRRAAAGVARPTN